METNIPQEFKACALKKINMLRQMEPGAGEYYKVKNWIDTFMKIPFNTYKNFDIKISNNLPEPKKSEPKKSEPKKSEPKIPDQSVQGNPGDLLALMPGKILKVLVSEGQKIKMGEPVIIMESMKMEQTIVSSADGVINSINVKEGETIEVGSVMIVIG